MVDTKNIIKKFDIKLHKLYHIIKAEWYGDQDDISDDYEEWAINYINDLLLECQIGCNTDNVPFEKYVETTIDECMKTYYKSIANRVGGNYEVL